MKNLQKIGVQELGVQEMRATEGGFIDIIYEVLTGRDFSADVRTVLKETIKAHAEVRAEGGKTSIDMPFP